MSWAPQQLSHWILLKVKKLSICLLERGIVIKTPVVQIKGTMNIRAEHQRQAVSSRAQEAVQHHAGDSCTHTTM